jgi:hypothetical protein
MNILIHYYVSEYGRANRPCHFSLRGTVMYVPASQCAYIGDRINRDYFLGQGSWDFGWQYRFITTMSMANWNVGQHRCRGEFDDRNSGSLAGGNEPFLPVQTNSPGVDI